MEIQNRIIEGCEIRKKEDALETRTLTFIASDNSKDAHGTVVPVDKWDLSRFNKNGVIGYNHNLHYSNNPDDVIGVGRAYIENDKLMVDVRFEPAEIKPLADKIFQKLMFGSLKAVSVGFNPTKRGYLGQGDESREGKNPTYYFDGQELLELSVVNIPSNKNALKKSLEAMLTEIDEADEELRKKKKEEEQGCKKEQEKEEEEEGKENEEELDEDTEE